MERQTRSRQKTKQTSFWLKERLNTDHVTTHQADDDARNEDILIRLNGRVVPNAEAMVSGYDSGFRLGDGVRKGLRPYDTGTGHFRSVRDTNNQQNDHRRACAVDGDTGPKTEFAQQAELYPGLYRRRKGRGVLDGYVRGTNPGGAD